MTDKPLPRSATELRIATEPEPHGSSDQVGEPATTPATREKAVDSDNAERSSAPCTVAEGELIMDLGLCNSEGERAPVPEFSPERAPVPPASPERASVSTSCSEKDCVPECSPVDPLSVMLPMLGVAIWCVWAAGSRIRTRPLLPPPPVSSGSPSVGPQPTICTVRDPNPQVCHPPSSLWLENPLPLPPASKPRTPPRPSTMAPPLGRVPSVHWLRWAPSSLRLRLGLSSTILCIGTPLLRLRLVPPAPSGSSFPSGSTLVLCHSSSTAAFWIPASALVAGAICSALVSGSSPLPWLISSPSPPRAYPPPTLLPLVGPWSRQLLPASAPPWVAVMAVAWVPPGTACSKSLLSSPRLLPPSDPPWLLLFPPWLLPPSSPPWTLSACPLPGVRPPPEPPPKFPPIPPSVATAQGRAFREGGHMSRPWTICVCFPPHVLPAT